MNFSSLYKKLPNNEKEYYLSLSVSQVHEILNDIVAESDSIFSQISIQKQITLDNYTDGKNSIWAKEQKIEKLDKWIGLNQDSKNTIDFQNVMDQYKLHYFDLREFKRITENEYKNSMMEIGHMEETMEKKLLSLLTNKLKFIKVNTEKQERTQQVFNKQEEERKQNLVKIQEIATQRDIKHLVHFTTLNFLDQLLVEGIFSTHKLKKEKKLDIDYIITDPHRWDNKLNWVSTSISFPNYRMFFSKRQNTYNLENLVGVTGWVILLLDARILWELKCGFTLDNAATREKISSSYKKFEQMFEKSNRRDPNLADKHPTNEQSEVLVEGFVPANYINTVVFDNKDEEKAYDFHKKTKGKYKIITDPKYFKWR